MRTIGKRKEPTPTGRASAENLIRGATLNETLQKLPTGNTTFIPRGKVYRFKTNDAANIFQEECVIACWYCQEQDSERIRCYGRRILQTSYHNRPDEPH